MSWRTLGIWALVAALGVALAWNGAIPPDAQLAVAGVLLLALGLALVPRSAWQAARERAAGRTSVLARVVGAVGVGVLAVAVYRWLVDRDIVIDDWVAVVVLVLALAAGVVWFTPFGRKVIARRVRTTGGQVLRTLRRLATEPGRFVTLFGSTLGVKASQVAAFILSCSAVGVDVSVSRLGLLFLTASSVAAAAPTPGGVGAVEAALTAALTGVGASPADALSAVFLFRLVTYWLPVPFGWLALHRLQRSVIA